jgi:hypothetical protein
VVIGLVLAGPCLGARGDVDPAYAGTGRLSGSVVPLPDGRVLDIQWAAQGAASTVTLRDIGGNVESVWGNAGSAQLPAGFWVNFRNSAIYAPDGGILIGGEIRSGAFGASMAVVKLTATGQLDASFGNGGVLTRADGDPLSPVPADACWQMVQGMAVLPDGNLLVLYMHYPECYEDPTRVVLRRFDANGRNEIPFPTPTGMWLPAESASYVEADLLRVVADGRMCIRDRRCFEPNGRESFVDSNVQSLFFPPHSDVYPVGMLANGDALFATDFLNNDLRVQRARSDGSPDPAFGDGGVLTIHAANLSPLVPVGSTVQLVRAIEGRAGHSIYLLAHALPVGYLICRLQIAPNGTTAPDFGFGVGGVVVLGPEFSMPLASYTSLIEQADGGLLVSGEASTFRLLGTGLASPGMLVLNAGVGAGGNVASARQTIRIVVSRVAGDDGAISIDYATADDTAKAGSEYRPASGRLTWADGDRSDREILVETLASARSGILQFRLDLTAAQGGGWLAKDRILLAVRGDAVTAPAPGPAPQPPADGGGVGGGGALGLGSLLLLLPLLGRRRVPRHPAFRGE